MGNQFGLGRIEVTEVVLGRVFSAMTIEPL
jgi:hypothetical protein